MARTLAREPLPPYVSVYEAGMAGFRLIDLWMGSDLCIVVDAMDAGEPAGTIREFDAGQLVTGVVPEQAISMSSHGVRLKDALELGLALGPPYIPNELRVFGIQIDAGRAGFGTGRLSTAVEQACDEVVMKIHEMCRSYAGRRVAAPRSSGS